MLRGMSFPVPQAARPGTAWVAPLGALLAACAVSGHAPLWMVPVWAVVMGWWALEPRRRITVFAPAVLLALLPVGRLVPDLLGASAVYAQVALAGLAAALSLAQLDDQGAWVGLVALVVAFALAPTPLALVGLVGAALLRAHVAQRGLQVQTTRRVWLWLAGGVAVLALVSLALPQAPSVGRRPAAPEAATTSRVPQGAPNVRPSLGAAPATGQAAAPVNPSDQILSLVVLERLMPFALPLMAVLMLVTVVMMLRERKRRGEEPLRLHEFVMLAAILVGLFMILLYFGLRGAGGLPSGVGADGARPATSLLTAVMDQLSRLLPEHTKRQILSAVGWLAVGSLALFVVLVLAGVVLLWRQRGRGGTGALTPRAEAAPTVASAEHRVRRAYREWLALLAGVGLVRAETETPQEFLARLRAVRPDLLNDSDLITSLYEPVRYGAQTDESGAQAAERALARVRAALAGDAPERKA